MVYKTLIFFLIFALFNVPSNAEEEVEYEDRRRVSRFLFWFPAGDGIKTNQDCVKEAEERLETGDYEEGRVPKTSVR